MTKLCIKILVEADSIVIGFHSWIFFYRARRQGARIASYLRRMSTTLCIKIHMKSDSVIESAFPYIYAFLYFFTKRAMRLSASAIFSRLAA